MSAASAGIDDRELGRQRERLGVRPDDAVRDGMEGAAEDALSRAAVRRLRPGEHVVRCPPRESEEEDAAWLRALLAEPGGARHQRAGLPGASASKNEERAAAMRGGSSLIVVEDIQNAGQLHGH